MWVTVSAILFISVFDLCSCQDTVTVSVAQGQLRGRIAYTINGAQYYSFQGIPYAKPPVGELRFRPPQPAEPWEGTKDALNWGSICPQPNVDGSEDCLFINVFSTQLPDNSAQTLNPVLVYIHGGGYLTGSGEFGPDYLLGNGDIVVVGLNYRLGAFGFISLPGTEITSNNGLKDQNLALKWVQQNIAQFGGDPNQVTIWGESAGATSVGMQMLSPMSTGLFRGVIADSGSVLTGWAIYAPGAATSTAFQLGQILGITTNDTSVLIDGLRTATAQEIVTATNSLAYLQFTMDIENEVGEGDEAFMPAAPLDLIKQGKYNDVPLIIGVNAQEGAINANLLDNQEYVDYINQYPEGLLPWQFNNSREIGARVKEFYFGNKTISHQTVMQFANEQTDFIFLYPSFLQVKLQTAISKTPIYFYKFSFDGRLKLQPELGDSIPGVPHADELYYIMFTGSTLPNDSPEMITTARMAKLWTNFVKSQNPSPADDPVLQNVTWSPFTQLDHFYLDIGNDLILGRDINNDRMGFVADMFSEIHIPE